MNDEKSIDELFTLLESAEYNLKENYPKLKDQIIPLVMEQIHKSIEILESMED
jgi:hypothetical protein